MSEKPIWFLNTHEGQRGPYTKAYIQELWNTGSIHGACHVWKEGFGNWLELRSVQAFQAPDVDAIPELTPGTEQSSSPLSNPEAARLAEIISDDDSRRPDLYRCLKKDGVLLLASYGLPASFVPGLNIAFADLDVTVATARDEKGKQLLIAFTSEQAIRKRFPRAESIGLEARNVLQMVASSEHAGLLLDPGGAGVRIPRDHIEAILSS